ncbi:carbohydrate ABC transporter permease [Georgenia sp. TF02-10]|uniref:carbohydrate ABC transporter permease n=1 Tax=Georgenia sp. TF02-10 TaxID=2917725 RepID=UPI001FA7DA71|nr:carbohydrate ABC transporter permease [Georgenia sp. TF02-10]UNX55801.1 carbohydrate ABC transporter permease [Georgenia sp. TF02-10]
MSQLVHRVTRRRSATSPTVAERTLISDNDLRSPGTRVVVAAWKSIFLVLLVLVGIFPLAWLVKAATSTTQDILGEPLGWWASGFYPENIARAWTSIKIDQYTWNTFAIALGVTFFSLLIATTGGYVLGVLKPRYAAVLNVAVMATLFVPGIIALVPLYLTIIDLPLLGISAINTFWAVWLPASVSAFNVLIVKQYFETIPSELYDAARVDGAGPLRVFFSIVLPLSRPILGVISLLAFIAAWKDFLWPLLALPDPERWPLSVALSFAERSADLKLVMAGMLIASVLPIVLFLVFQKQFLQGVSVSGSVKG